MTTKLGRKSTKKCKNCGKKFKDENFTRICPECFTTKRKILAKITAEKDQQEKQNWQRKIGTIQTDKTTKEKWNQATLIPTTERHCSTCGQEHYKDTKYNHQYTQKTKSKGITLEDTLTLLIEFEKEKENNPKTEAIRYLQRKGLIQSGY